MEVQPIYISSGTTDTEGEQESQDLLRECCKPVVELLCCCDREFIL